jgi:hypothetical protein
VDACQWPVVSSLSPAIFGGPVGFFAFRKYLSFILIVRPTYNWPVHQLWHYCDKLLFDNYVLIA